MTDLIGVVAGDAPLQAFVPKKDLLLFDRIAFSGLDRFIKLMAPSNDEDGQWLAQEYAFLRTSGFIFDPFSDLPRDLLSRNAHYGFYKEKAETALAEIENIVRNGQSYSGLLAMEQFAQWARQVRYFESMAYTNYLIQERHYDACCILDPDDLTPDANATKSPVAVLILDKFPIPSDETPWENIVAFRNDPAARERRLAIRLWITEMARGEYDLREVHDRVEYLLLSYENYMKEYHIKYEYGLLKSAVVTLAEILEDLARFKFSKVAKVLFSVHDKKLELLEAERKAPGRELSYISLAQRQFQ